MNHFHLYNDEEREALIRAIDEAAAFLVHTHYGGDGPKKNGEEEGEPEDARWLEIVHGIRERLEQ